MEEEDGGKVGKICHIELQRLLLGGSLTNLLLLLFLLFENCAQVAELHLYIFLRAEPAFRPTINTLLGFP